MSPPPRLSRPLRRFPRSRRGCGGAEVSLALSSGQSTPRSGIGASGALGSSSAGSGAAAGEERAARAGGAGEAAQGPAAHSSRAALSLNPRPIIREAGLPALLNRASQAQALTVQGLVDGAVHFVAAQRRDQALDCRQWQKRATLPSSRLRSARAAASNPASSPKSSIRSEASASAARPLMKGLSMRPS